MINAYYQYETQEWEVKLYGESPKEDKILGVYKTYEEAQEQLKKFHKEGK